MKLINKKWGIQNKEWVIPPEDREGNLAEKGSSQVYGQGQKIGCSYGPKVFSQKRGYKQKGCETTSGSQQWIRSKNDANGDFTITNKATGLLLTAKDNKTFIIKGMI